MSRNLYILSLLAAIFLPLNFLRALFGMSMGGNPIIDRPWGFPVLTIGLAVFAALIVYLFYRFQWLRPIRHLGSR